MRAALLAFAALAVGACQPVDDGRTSGPISCPPPEESIPQDETLDAQTLIGEKVDDATQAAIQYGCRVRVVVRDGRATASGTPGKRVIDVEVRDGRVTRIVGVGRG